MKILRQRSRKIGLPPGSLVSMANGNGNKGEPQITLFDYNSQDLTRKNDASIEDCLVMMKTDAITWVNICGIHDPKMIEAIGKRFDLHPLLLEDILNSGQRSKLDDYGETIYVVMRYLNYDVTGTTIVDEQVSLILGKNYVISFLESCSTIFQPIINQLNLPSSRLRSCGADYLFYCLIDCLVDHYFLVFEQFDMHLAKLEDELSGQASPLTLRKIQNMKRELNLIRRSIWPAREVINHFARIDSPLILQSTRLYIHDVYDHVVQAIDVIETFRDVSGSLVDIYLSNMSFKLNEVMKVLTVAATIFAPITFIASLYGMNFQNMPELQWKYGYFYCLSLMAAIALTMGIYFKRKKWI